jgi:hypothetical protein
MFQSTGKAKSMLSGELGKHRGRYDYWPPCFSFQLDAPAKRKMVEKAMALKVGDSFQTVMNRASTLPRGGRLPGVPGVLGDESSPGCE